MRLRVVGGVWRAGAVKPDFGAVCAVWNSWRYSECGVMRADGAVDRVAEANIASGYGLP